MGFIGNMPLSFKRPSLSHASRLALLIGIAAAMMNSNALAGGMFSPETASISIPVEITVPGNSPTGSTLWKSVPLLLSLRAERNLNDPSAILGAEIFANIQSGTKASGFPDVYATNVPGLGVRWWGKWRGRNFPNGIAMPITTNSENNAGALGWDWGDSPRTQEVWIELVKTGNIGAGQISGLRMNAHLQFLCRPCNPATISLAGSTRVVTGPSCTVANSAVSVPMGIVTTSRFTGIHSTTRSQSFDITLDCKGGAPDSKLRPHVTLTDANDSSNQGTILTLSKATTGGKPVATGIGIQILKDGIPLAYGPDSSAPGNTNQWSAGTIAQGVAQFKIPLTANYVQTAESVTTGQANGRATFTLNYQ